MVNLGWGAPLNICTDVALIVNSPQYVIYIGPRTASGTCTDSASRVRALAAGAGPVTHHEATLRDDENGGVSVVDQVQTTLEATVGNG